MFIVHFVYLFIYLILFEVRDTEREGEKELFLPPVMPHMAMMSMSGPSQSQSQELLPGSPVWVVEAQALGPISCFSQVISKKLDQK